MTLAVKKGCIHTNNQHTALLIFGSDANSIRNLCGPAGVRVYVCMDSMWMRLGLTTGDMNNGIPCHQLYNTMHTMGHQL